MATDITLIHRMQGAQSGVFSTSDMQSLLGEKHPAGFVRRVSSLERGGFVQRFIRGWYVTPSSFDLATLSQRIAPDSYVSFGTALAAALVVGPVPEKELWAAKTGRSRVYRGLGYRVVHLGLDPRLVFGFEQRGALRWATPEKAFLDCLYFHLRGKRYPFDIFSDIHLATLNHEVVREFLRRYNNPKFVTFVEGILDGSA